MTIQSSPPASEARLNGTDVNDKAPLLPIKEETVIHEFNKASFSGAVFNLSTTIIGAGIMALPAAMKVLGVGLGLMMIIFMALLTEASIELLIDFSRASKCWSYGGLMGNAFGKFGKVLLQIAVIVNNAGMLVVYTIIIGDVLCGTSSGGVHHEGVLEGWFGGHWWNTRTFILLIIMFAVFSPLSFFKQIDSLRFTSALSVVLAFVFLIIMLGITLYKMAQGNITMPRLWPKVTDVYSFLKLFTVVPVFVTAYICHYNVHSINNELQHPAQMKPVVRTSLALCSTVYIMTSTVGFLLFGDATHDDVLANFDTSLHIPHSYLLTDTMRISYAVHLMLVFPLVFFPLRFNLDGLLFPASPHLYQSNLRFVLVTAGLLGAIFLGANFIPSIWDAFQLTGATAAVCLGFIFPASITLRDRPHIATTKDKILCVLMIVLAVFSNTIALSSDAFALYRKMSHS